MFSATVEPYAPLPVRDLSAHDTVVNGKKAVVLQWAYDPVSTFGFPITDYRFHLARGGDSLAMVSASERIYLDTTAVLSGYTYDVRVETASSSSVAATVRYGSQKVSDRDAIASTYRFLNALEAGREGRLRVTTAVPCHLNVSVYDEVGRELSQLTSDAALASKHTIAFTPSAQGVLFFRVRMETATGASEMFLKGMVQ
jgi:hypothetical protein